MNQEELLALELQSTDPLSIAEKITGISYKDDENTGYLGLSLQMDKSKMLTDLLNEIGDTTFSNKVDEYIAKLSKFGFEVVLCEPFKNTHYEDITEEYYILFNKELGVLIEFDTFGYENTETHNVNGGSIYYNWSPNNDKNTHSLLSSGGYVHNKFDNILFNEDFTPHQIDLTILPEDPIWINGTSYESYGKLRDEWNLLYNQYVSSNNLRMVWSGNHDCREAVISNIKRLSENGQFLTKWVECSFNWLLNFSEHSSKDEPFDDFRIRAMEITKNRISKLPDYVKECIGEYN